MQTNILRGEIVAKFGTLCAFSKALNWHKNKLSRLMTAKYLPNINETAKMAELLEITHENYM